MHQMQCPLSHEKALNRKNEDNFIALVFKIPNLSLTTKLEIFFEIFKDSLVKSTW